jgi:hypothetical protein
MIAPPSWEIPDEIRARLSDQSGRQRAMIADGHIVMVLHRVPQPRNHKREGLLFWRKTNGEWAFNQGRPGLVTLKQVVGDYSTAIIALERARGRADNADAWFRILEEVGPLCRAARNLYNVLQEARGAIPDARQRNELQGPCDVASDVARTAELLQADSRDALDFHIAKQGEVQSRLSRNLTRTGQRLNMMACVFLPVAAVASVFGMNLNHGLEGSPVWVFWSVLAGGTLLGIIISGLLLDGQGDKRDGKIR